MPVYVLIGLWVALADLGAATLAVEVNDREGTAFGRVRVFAVGASSATDQAFLAEGRAEFELDAGSYRVEVEYRGTVPAQTAAVGDIELAEGGARQVDGRVAGRVPGRRRPGGRPVVGFSP